MLASARLCISSYYSSEDKKVQILQKGMEIIDGSIEELRKISKSLLPPSLGDFTLKESIEQLALNIELAQKKSRIELSSLKEQNLGAGLKISIYRIAQEQLNNILKYSKASVVDIVIRQTDTVLELDIADDGVGFDVDKKRTGIGLTNIINRATTFNGKVIIDLYQVKDAG